MKPCILVVDDDPEIFELLADLLGEEGFEMRWARNSAEFRQQILLRQPDLIMLDIMLGSENGPNVYKKLLVEGLDRTIPVIFISGLIPTDEIHPPVQPGRRYALHAKPFQFDRLLSDIRSLTSAA